VQILLPGETAPAHWHSPAAIRFIIQGKGVYTTVEGDQCFMGPGDLVLIPPWTWHDHGNGSDEPVLWRDGLDLPFVRDVDATFFEPFAGARSNRSQNPPMTRSVAMALGNYAPPGSSRWPLVAATQLQVGTHRGSVTAVGHLWR